MAGPSYRLVPVLNQVGDIAAGNGLLVLQDYVAPATGPGPTTVAPYEMTMFGLEFHVSGEYPSAWRQPVFTLWALPQNFNVTQLTGTTLQAACTNFQNNLWCVFKGVPRAANPIGGNNYFEVTARVSSKRTIPSNGGWAIVVYDSANQAATDPLFAGHIEYFYA